MRKHLLLCRPTKSKIDVQDLGDVLHYAFLRECFFFIILLELAGCGNWYDPPRTKYQFSPVQKRALEDNIQSYFHAEHARGSGLSTAWKGQQHIHED